MLIIGCATSAWANDFSALHGRGFSVRNIKGAYSFSFEGKIVGLGPVAAVGRLVADGRGNITDAVRTIVVNGASLPQTFTCTLIVQPEGTGSAICPLDDPDASIETFDFALEEKGRTFRFVGTTPGVVVLGSGRRQ
jgi:hypothetical protein